MISCPKCRKENQDHYKFCLGCGAELPRDAAPKPFAPRTPPHGMRAVGAGSVRGPAQSASSSSAASAPVPLAGPAPRPAAAPVEVPRPKPEPVPVAAPAPEPEPVPAPRPVAAPPSVPAPAASGTITCPQCGHVNSSAFKFCASCGLNLAKAAQSASSAAAAIAAPAAAVNWKLVVLRADGTDAGVYDVPAQGATIGRDLGGIFAGDAYLSPKHARISTRGGKLMIEDNGSTNGTYIRLKRDEPVELGDGHMFRIGQEIIRFERLHPEPLREGVELMGSPSAGYVGRITLVTGRNATGNAFPIPRTGVHIGRERGHVMFPEDGYVSGLHCSLSTKGDQLLLTDLGSSNGTFLRLHAEHELHEGDILLMGQQLFRVAT